MFTKLCRRAKHRVAALLIVATATAGTVLVQPEPAHAIISFPAPLGCHTYIRPIQWKPGVFAFYEFAFEYRGRRLGRRPGALCPGHVPLRAYLRLSGPEHDLSLWAGARGRAEKVCGSVIYWG